MLEDLRGFLRRVINNFPKAIKRVLIRFGLGEIKRKIEEVREEYGIEVVYVNPAYSSQACSNYGYVDKGNRKVRRKNLFIKRFKCLWSKAKGLIERNPYFQSVPKPEAWVNVSKRDICPC